MSNKTEEIKRKTTMSMLVEDIEEYKQIKRRYMIAHNPPIRKLLDSKFVLMLAQKFEPEVKKLESRKKETGK